MVRIAALASLGDAAGTLHSFVYHAGFLQRVYVTWTRGDCRTVIPLPYNGRLTFWCAACQKFTSPQPVSAQLTG